MMGDSTKTFTDTVDGLGDSSLDGHSILKIENLPTELGKGATIQHTTCSVYSYGVPRETKSSCMPSDTDLFIMTIALFVIILGALLWKAGR